MENPRDNPEAPSPCSREQVFRGMREFLIHRSPDRCPDHRRFPIVVPIIVSIVVGKNEKTKIKTKIKNDDDRDEDRDEDNRLTTTSWKKSLPDLFA